MNLTLVLKPVGGSPQLHMREGEQKARDRLAPTLGSAQLLPSRSVARMVHWLGREDGVAVGRGTWVSSPALAGGARIPGWWGLESVAGPC